MLKAIGRLLFGGEEEAPGELESEEAVEEGWLVVSHQEADSAENQNMQTADTQSPNSSANTEADSMLEAEATVQSSSSSTSQAMPGPFFKPKALTGITQLASIQKAKTWADRHYASRNAIHRQNRIRQGVQQHSFHLQQPSHRSLSH
ncbi:tumor protein p53-inducible nuclear protein 2 isoform 1-T2 [Pholidichthys leucotaenia]